MSYSTESVERQPASYSPVANNKSGLSHFRDMQKKRDVPGEAIRACIEDGELQSCPVDEYFEARAEVYGTEYFVVLDVSTCEAVTCGKVTKHDINAIK